MTKEQWAERRLVLIKNLIRQLITDTTSSRMVSILEAGNGLAALLPEAHINRKIVHDTAWEMHQASIN
jgi:hypothetical protein